jgi:hypothetical protein
MLDAVVSRQPTLGTCGLLIPRDFFVYLLVRERTFALNCRFKERASHIDLVSISSTSLAVMRFVEKIVYGTLAATVGVSAQETFEAPDFNVTEALIDNGVNISAIPALAGLVSRSSLGGCSIAVSCDAVPHSSIS